MAERSATADAIRAALISPNVPDSNGEPANLVDMAHFIALQLGRIADGLQEVAAALREGGER